MARFLISTMPAAGHVNPVLPVAARLAERGHEIRWHTAPQFASRVRATGAEFVPTRHVLNFDQLPHQPRGGTRGLLSFNGEIRRLFVDRAPGQLADYREILEGFPADALLVDVCSLGAALLRELGGPPWASLGITPLALPSPDAPAWNLRFQPPRTAAGRVANRLVQWGCDRLLLHDAAAEVDRQRARLGLGPDRRGLAEVLVSPYLHLQCCAPSFEYPRRDLPGHVRFVGPLLPEERFVRPGWWHEVESHPAVVHVTQGTAAIAAGRLVVPALRALADEDVLVVVTALDVTPLGRVPPNARIERYVPYRCLLPYARVMVTNGGYGGVNMALAHGVPVVAAGASEDKRGVGARVRWSGVGIDLATDRPSPERLHTAVRMVLGDPAYRRRAERIRDECARIDGPTEAARLLEVLAATGASVA